jgi:hypothetical protein
VWHSVFNAARIALAALGRTRSKMRARDHRDEAFEAQSSE